MSAYMERQKWHVLNIYYLGETRKHNYGADRSRIKVNSGLEPNSAQWIPVPWTDHCATSAQYTTEEYGINVASSLYSLCSNVLIIKPNVPDIIPTLYVPMSWYWSQVLEILCQCLHHWISSGWLSSQHCPNLWQLSRYFDIISTIVHGWTAREPPQLTHCLLMFVV